MLRRSFHPRLGCALFLVLGACGANGGFSMNSDGGTDAPVEGGADTSSPPGDGAASGYTEPVCAEPLASLADLAMAYQNTPEGLRAACQGIADRRYPIGRAFVDFQNDMQLQAWNQRRNTFNDVLSNFEVTVHEGQHLWDLRMISGSWPYRLRDDLVIRTRVLRNFNRSELLRVHTDPASDTYARVYLMGSSGMQGFNTLLDEYTAYVHSLASRYCTRDGLSPSVRISSRDGILTLMYYVELYLRLARTEHPEDYQAILADPEHRRLILTNWDRAEFWLRLSQPFPQLGLRDTMIRAWTYNPENLMEIERLRR